MTSDYKINQIQINMLQYVKFLFPWHNLCFLVPFLKTEGKYLSHCDRGRCLPEDVCWLENVGSLYIWWYVIVWRVTKEVKRIAMLCMIYPGICTTISKYNWFLQNYCSFFYQGFWMPILPWITYVSRWDRFISSNSCTFTDNSSGYILLRRSSRRNDGVCHNVADIKIWENSQGFVNQGYS